MMKITIPFIIIEWILLTKLPVLGSSVLVILGEVTHFFGGLSGDRRAKAFSLSSFELVDG
jgi:hypothetical protein